MLQGRFVVVVAPAYQEEDHVGRVIETMPRFVDRIIVVDDGSTDRTCEVVRSMPAEARATLVCHSKRRGVGAAIATGYKRAIELARRDDDAIAVMAGDGQMHPDDLARVVAPIASGTAD